MQASQPKQNSLFLIDCAANGEGGRQLRTKQDLDLKCSFSQDKLNNTSFSHLNSDLLIFVFCSLQLARGKSQNLKPFCFFDFKQPILHVPFK